MTGVQAAILGHLMLAAGPLTSDELVDLVYGHDPEGGPLSSRDCIKVAVHFLRQKGHVIHNRYNRGYWMHGPEPAFTRREQQIIDLISRPPPKSAARLAALMETSTDIVQTYLSRMRKAGVPIRTLPYPHAKPTSYAL